MYYADKVVDSVVGWVAGQRPALQPRSAAERRQVEARVGQAFTE